MRPTLSPGSHPCPRIEALVPSSSCLGDKHGAYFCPISPVTPNAATQQVLKDLNCIAAQAHSASNVNRASGQSFLSLPWAGLAHDLVQIRSLLSPSTPLLCTVARLTIRDPLTRGRPQPGPFSMPSAWSSPALAWEWYPLPLLDLWGLHPTFAPFLPPTVLACFSSGLFHFSHLLGSSSQAARTATCPDSDVHLEHFAPGT